MEEKRNYRRYEIWFPITLSVAGDEVWSICRDVSPGGVLVSAERSIDVGTTVRARFKVSPDEEDERAIEAQVVRVELNKDELVLAFPHRIALEFASAVPGLLDVLDRGSSRWMAAAPSPSTDRE